MSRSPGGFAPACIHLNWARTGLGALTPDLKSEAEENECVTEEEAKVKGTVLNASHAHFLADKETKMPDKLLV